MYLLPHQTHDYIDTHFDAHLAHTQTFLRQPSLSAQNMGVRQCADLLRSWLIERGAYVEYHGSDTHPLICAEWFVGAPKTLLVYGMYDVQPVDDQPWTSPPFAADIREHSVGGPSIFARGACNSKGPLMAFLHTVEALRTTTGLPVNIRWTEDLGTARLKRDLPPLELLKHMQFGIALNINGIVSGYTGPGTHTIIPNIAKAKLDLRLPPGVSVEQVYNAIRAHLDRRGFPNLEIILDSGYPAARTPLNALVMQALIQTYRAHGYEPVIRPLETSATPYYLFTDVLGLPMTWGGLGAAGGSHGPDEWCSVQGLKDLEKSLATYLTVFAETKGVPLELLEPT